VKDLNAFAWDRITFAHRCYDLGPHGEKIGSCEQPGAHFQGTDEEWAIFVRIARGDILTAEEARRAT
jgi:hypothetical protein